VLINTGMWKRIFVELFNTEVETRLNNILEFSPYVKENTALHHYNDELFNAV
jgi:hypothetical protein